MRPLNLGRHELKHRAVLAPMTRMRATDDHIPLPVIKDYYAQRASTPGTLLITEGTLISEEGSGYHNAPGIYNTAQIAAWKVITDAVHARQCVIYCQLWALGRAADPEMLRAKGYDVTGSSSIVWKEGVAPPRELSDGEIRKWIADFAIAAKNAILAGFGKFSRPFSSPATLRLHRCRVADSEPR